MTKRLVGVPPLLALVGLAMWTVACPGPARPGPQAPTSEWETYCKGLTDKGCGMCAGDEHCGYCPTTSQCVLYDEQHQEAAASCPAIYRNTEQCPN